MARCLSLHHPADRLERRCYATGYQEDVAKIHTFPCRRSGWASIN